ncbi:MAG: hypothetical protein QOI17_998 [Gaiellales bacterium]|nr:hypothetical protein [Gaiellales bacterium]
MSTRITLRLAGLTAAIAVALALTSTAAAKPTSGAIYVTANGTTGIHPATGPADRPGEVGTPTLPATGPADRPGEVGTPAAVPLSVSTPAVISSQSSGFNWADAMLGALAAFAITLSAGFAIGQMRGRGGIALRF